MIRRAILFFALVLCLPARDYYIITDGTSIMHDISQQNVMHSKLTTDGHTYHALEVSESGSTLGAYTSGCEGIGLNHACKAVINIDPYFGNFSTAECWLLLDGPTNDMHALSTDDLVVYNNAVAYFAKRKTAAAAAPRSCKWVVATMFPRMWDNTDPTEVGSLNALAETERTQFNTRILNDCGVGASAVFTDATYGGRVLRCVSGSAFDYVMDLGVADSRFNDYRDNITAGLCGGANCFSSDGIHLASAGSTVFGTMWANVLEVTEASQASGIAISGNVASSGKVVQ